MINEGEVRKKTDTFVCGKCTLINPIQSRKCKVLLSCPVSDTQMDGLVLFLIV